MMICTTVLRTVGDMRGDQHLLISLFSGLLLLVPFIPGFSTVIIVAIISGLAIGSLAPDADARDAAIFHKKIKIKGNLGYLMSPLGYVMPFFGYLIRYVIYFPVSLVFWVFIRKTGRPRHRGLLHSVPGMLITFILIGCYLYLMFMMLGLDFSYLILPFTAAFAGGFLMHMLEDSCTPTGVAWFFPFSKCRICGEVRTDKRREYRPAVLIFSLGIAIIALFISGTYSGEAGSAEIWIPVLMLLAVWAVFLLCAGVRFNN